MYFVVEIDQMDTVYLISKLSTNMRDNAFQNCSTRELIIQKNIASIRKNDFYSCQHFKETKLVHICI